jgi:hypothetical protein
VLTNRRYRRSGSGIRRKAGADLEVASMNYVPAAPSSTHTLPTDVSRVQEVRS